MLKVISYQQVPTSEHESQADPDRWQDWTPEKWAEWHATRRRRWRSNHSTGSSHDDENSHEPDAIKWEQFDFGDVQLLPPEILDWIVLRKVAFQLLNVFQCSVPSTTSWT